MLQTWKKSKVPGIAIKSVVDTYLDCAKLKIDHLFATNLNQNKKSKFLEFVIIYLSFD